MTFRRQLIWTSVAGGLLYLYLPVSSVVARLMGWQYDTELAFHISGFGAGVLLVFGVAGRLLLRATWFAMIKPMSGELADTLHNNWLRGFFSPIVRVWIHVDLNGEDLSGEKVKYTVVDGWNIRDPD